jgi:hypothetical protein
MVKDFDIERSSIPNCTNHEKEDKGGVVSLILNRHESATVIAGLRLLAGDGVRVPNYPHVLVAGMCDETEPEYDLRFDAGEEYVRELIDRIDAMSLPRVRMCNRQRKRGKAQCADCNRKVERHFVLQKGAAVARRTSRGIG